MLIRNFSLFDKNARECFCTDLILLWHDSWFRWLPSAIEHNFLPQNEKSWTACYFPWSSVVTMTHDTLTLSSILRANRWGPLLGHMAQRSEIKKNKQTEPHTKALIQRMRNVLFNIYTFFIPSRWFSLFCKLLFAVAGADDALADIEQDILPLSGLWLDWNDRNVDEFARTAFEREKHVQLQLKSTNCGKQLELTSNLSFNVVDVWMPFQRHKKKSLSTEVFQSFVCAENTKSTKTIVNIWELFFLYAAAECNWHLCAPCDKPVNERGCWAKVLL